MASDASARIEGDALFLAGTLDRAAAVTLWPQLSRLAGQLRRLDLHAVERVDSAGVALLAELAARLPSNDAIAGTPAGLDELRAAYRLSPSLDFNASTAGS